MAPFTGMEKLRLLSLSRNALKRIERLEDVAETLEELWLSYNLISSLDGLQGCNKLRTLYIGNNKISDLGELDKLASLPELRELLVLGNPMFDGMDKPTARVAVVRKLPNLAKLDNEMITGAERDAAKA
jgi:dynein light chain 1